MYKKKILYIVLCIIACIMLFNGTFDRAYDYYTILRIIVTSISIYCCYKFFSVDINAFGCIYLVVIFLFNPILPVSLGKDAWCSIDFFVSILFFVSIFYVNKVNK